MACIDRGNRESPCLTGNVNVEVEGHMAMYAYKFDLVATMAGSISCSHFEYAQ